TAGYSQRKNLATEFRLRSTDRRKDYCLKRSKPYGCRCHAGFIYLSSCQRAITSGGRGSLGLANFDTIRPARSLLSPRYRKIETGRITATGELRAQQHCYPNKTRQPTYQCRNHFRFKIAERCDHW